MKFLHTHWYWRDVAHLIDKWHLGLVEFCRGSNSEKKSETFDKILKTIWKVLAQGIAKWHLSSVEALPSAKFWNSGNGPISWTEWNSLINVCVNIDIDKIRPKRLRTDIFYRPRLFRALNSEKVKMAPSLELWRIVWWNFANTLVLMSCSQWDCQITIGIGRGFAEVQILKKVKLVLSPEPLGIFW